jgi:hypothetical protein
MAAKTSSRGTEALVIIGNGMAGVRLAQDCFCSTSLSERSTRSPGRICKIR